MFKTAIAGWLFRRVLDWGGWIGTFAITVIGLYNALPVSSQNAIGKALQGDWQNITLGAVIPLAALIVSQVMSLRATIKPQAVNESGQKINLDALPKATQTIVNEQTATAVAKKKKAPNILEQLIHRK